MSQWTTTLRPDRAMAFPFVASLSVALWFLLREAGIRSARGDLAADLVGGVLLAALSVVASYVFSALLVTGLDLSAGGAPDWASRLLAPSDATLLAVTVVSAVLGTYVVLGTVGTVPDWVAVVAAPAGIVLGWPLFVAVGASYALGNAVGVELPFLAEAGFVAFGVVLVVVWLFVLSSWVLALAGDRTTANAVAGR